MSETGAGAGPSEKTFTFIKLRREACSAGRRIEQNSVNSGNQRTKCKERTDLYEVNSFEVNPVLKAHIFIVPQVVASLAEI